MNLSPPPSLPLFDLPAPPPPPRGGPGRGLLLPDPAPDGARPAAARAPVQLDWLNLPADSDAPPTRSGPGLPPLDWPDPFDRCGLPGLPERPERLEPPGEDDVQTPLHPTLHPIQAPTLPTAGTPAALPPGLHPALWRASSLGGGPQRCTATGFAPLDAQLPGGGWPHGVLTELLLPQAGIGELRLLAPALAALGGPAGGGGVAGGAGSAAAAEPVPACVMLFDPPAQLSAWALAQHGLSPQHWLVVHGRARPAAAGVGEGAAAAPRHGPRRANGLSPLLASADLLWALEQALRSGHVGAVLAWLPLQLRADALRRLQLAAQLHGGPVFVLRDAQARSQPSVAPLRLLLQPAGVDDLSVRLLKRRGPPLAEPLRLALPPVLPPQQQAQARTRLALQGAARRAARGPALAPRRLVTALPQPD